ncbi:hypothetical protein [Nevskia sp.]|uniref:hypothetical protein n=1 Tax=Nevskia sp. TaxID=1929292 RepID=UPI0025F5E76B|nr:hypothetical protein [Nevskia sp.]
MSLPAKLRHAVLAPLLAAALMAVLPAANAQLLLKDGQGLAGAPKAVPEKGKDDTSPVTELPEVKVEGEVDELTKGDRKRRNQAKRLPGLGTEEERKLDRLEKLQQWYGDLPKDPNNLNEDSQQFLDTAVENDDARGVTRPGTPNSVPRRNPADYKDPLAKP